MPSLLKEQGSLSLIKEELARFLKPALPLRWAEIVSLLEKPRQPEHGHLSLPLFALAKKIGKAPQELAKELAELFSQNLPPYLKSCKALSAFVNFQFQESYFQKNIEFLLEKKELASFCREKEEHWLIDFASPNVAKHINIGHFRAAIVGQALVNLARAFGFKVTGLNHLGDWGSQFGKLLYAYKKWGAKYDFKNQAFSSLVELYIRFHKEAKEETQKQARELFQKLERGDPELKKLWSRFVALSLKNYEKYWKALNITHDLVLGESFYAPLVNDLKQSLKDKKLLKKSLGAEVVFLEEGTVPCLISKSDGASTYSARDLASLIYRFEKLKAHKNIYITGSDQILHFQQVLQVAGKLKAQWKEQSLHLSFGMYRFKGEGKMSSRQGEAVFLKDILEQVVERVEKIIQERNPELKNKKEISWQVGVGALIFNDLMNDRVKDVDFEWSKVLDFEGRSGPFVQYSLVRSRSLLRRNKKPLPKKFSLPPDGIEEKRLIWRLLSFEEAVFLSLKNFKPHILARYLLDLAKEFNRFYAAQRVLGHQRELDLLLLTKAVHRSLYRGLEILNVPRPKAM